MSTDIPTYLLFSVGWFGAQQSKKVQEMELAPSLLLGLCGFSLKACQRLAFKKLQDDDTKHKTLLHLIVSRIDQVALLIKNQKKWQLKTSLQEFQTGLKYLEKELNNQNRDQVEKTPRAELKINDTFVEASLLTETMTHLSKLADLDEAAEGLKDARKTFEKVCDDARAAFNSDGLSTAEQILAANVGVTAAILTKIKDPSRALPVCEIWLGDLNKMERVKEIFRQIFRSGKKDPFRGDEHIKNCFLGVYHTNSVVYEISRIAEIADKPNELCWIWPFIEVEKKKVDPLRDIRVSETLSKNGDMERYRFPWSFGQGPEKEKKLKAAQDIAINKEGHFIVVDKGDQMVKIFDEKGIFLRSFQPLSRRLADEDVRGVSTDHEDNLFVLIMIDKYHHEVRVFDQNGNLKSRFRLREGSVRCSLVANDNKEILVINEEPASDRCVVELYAHKNGRYVRSIVPEDPAEPSEPEEANGLKSPNEEDPKEPKAQKETDRSDSTPKGARKSKEPEDKDSKEQKKSQESNAPLKPKDIAITDNGIVLVLNDDGSVKKFGGKTQPHQMNEEINAKGGETIAFHSPSKHVLIANRSDGIVKVSVFSECGKLVTSFYVYEDKDVQEKKEYIAPRIAVTADGRIAVLNGFAGESKVTVV